MYGDAGTCWRAMHESQQLLEMEPSLAGEQTHLDPTFADVTTTSVPKHRRINTQATRPTADVMFVMFDNTTNNLLAQATRPTADVIFDNTTNTFRCSPEEAALHEPNRLAAPSILLAHRQYSYAHVDSVHVAQHKGHKAQQHHRPPATPA
eukprot:GHUV01022513.1.p1 GENE.GHUV01022513.1~~GHUV01022513.1.p1  ORF type:complete len:150 (-),score=25.41 GHUV01022513.1:366-815(-)